MLRIGLTGGIGSGKSTVAGIFEVLGAPVSYADQEARRLMDGDEDLRSQIIRRFGAEAYTQDGKGPLNRAWMSREVFSDPAKLEWLNALVHPVTLKAAAQWMEEQASRQTPYAIKEAALIFESRAAQGLDWIIGVEAPRELRIQRAMERDRITREAVLGRMRNQIDEELKMKLCDVVIRNDDREALLPQVQQIHQRLLTWAATSVLPAHP